MREIAFICRVSRFPNHKVLVASIGFKYVYHAMRLIRISLSHTHTLMRAYQQNKNTTQLLAVSDEWIANITDTIDACHCKSKFYQQRRLFKISSQSNVELEKIIHAHGVESTY